MIKKRILVIFGGQSSEHIVSCMSAVNVINNIDRDTYDVLIVGITEEGHWLLVDSVEAIQDESWRDGTVQAVLSPDATEKSVIVIDGAGIKKIKVDGAFPVSMDKFFTKIIADRVGVRQAAYEPVMKEEIAGTEGMAEAVKRVEARFAYPVFIKPSNAGSSRGVSKAENREQLTEGLTEAARHDRKILVEETIVGHEIECAVFGNGKEPVIASGVGEVLAAAQFYDFEAKYFNAESRTVVNPELPGDSAERVRRAAVEIFKAVDGYGLARVDFFVRKDGDVVFNEINTMPGFTAISMYPMLFEAAGISKTELVGKLIEHGMKRY